jgi:hypothetical protein
LLLIVLRMASALPYFMACSGTRLYLKEKA